MITFNQILINILIYCTTPFGAIFIAITLISKTILKENGYEVNYLEPGFYTDIKNLKKLSKEKEDLRVLYYSKLFATIAVLSLFLLIFLFIILSVIYPESIP
jgi:hypothetical protein